MNRQFTEAPGRPNRPPGGFGVTRLPWNLIRAPFLALLGLAEPLVRIGLTALGLLSLLMAGFYRLAGAAVHHSPVIGFLVLAIGCGMGLLGYGSLLRRLSR
jgi:hypothetical protein